MAHDPSESLKQSLQRMSQALETRQPRKASTITVSPGLVARRGPDLRALSTAAGAGALGVAAAATGLWWLLIPAGALGLFAGMFFGQHWARPMLTRGGTRAHVGMGASVAGDAVVEPGAAIEMGASVESGAIVRAGAVVRWGAVVRAGAVIEPGAVVSWGACVGERAVVGANASVGPGADIAAGARVLPDTLIWPGAEVSAPSGASLPAASATSSTAAASPALPATDPRLERVRSACDRLLAELAAAPEAARSFLGDPEGTVRALRTSCESLFERERALRAESAPDALARLEKEREALAKQAQSASDEAVRRSLSGALAAIDEQKRQREALRRHAERLEAEQTRLLYTIEGLAAQVVRLRTAGVEAGAAPAGEVETSVAQLRDELEAIADALEAVHRPEAERVMERISEPAPEGTNSSSEKTRERS
ncbi:MAG: hypothetical protein QM765_29680 [Myxococcales bacterium]